MDFDPENSEMSLVVDKFRQKRQKKTYRVYEYLIHKGYKFPRQDEVLAKNNGQLVHPLDNALLLREHGYTPDWPTAMEIIRQGGHTSTRVDMAETVEVTHRSGGVCFIAHPGRREMSFTFYDPAFCQMNCVQMCQLMGSKFIIHHIAQRVSKYTWST